MSHELYYHQQLILRLPSDLAEKISHILTHSKPIDSANPPIQIEVTYQEKSYFEFVYGEEKYPAILSHLPCNIETHKTFDHITYYKSSDISQMLYVFHTNEERERCHQELLKNSMGQKCFPSGITPPTVDIIKKKFSKTRRQKPQPPELVTQIEAELTRYTVTEDTEEIYEEVVPFEKYMADAAHPEGNSFTFSSKIGTDLSIFLEHPEILLTSKDEELRKKLYASTVEAAPLPMTAPLTVLSSTKIAQQPQVTAKAADEPQEQEQEEEDDSSCSSSDDDEWLKETTENL